ncbi:MAG: SRPBCC family protein [Rhizobiales bacterium]|nr:SRPBCC family protein [Hyphomicrobiales bacterium]
MPQIKQVFTVRHPRPVVWAQFQDLPKVVQCLPGASLTELTSPEHAKGRMTVKLGPVKADFDGEMDIAADEATYTGTIVGTGTAKSHGSRAKGDVRYGLEPTADGAGTTVSVLVDYTLSGSLAQFARGGIVDAVADQICKAFAANLEQQLNAASAAAAPPAATERSAAPGPAIERPAAPVAPAGPSELNVIALLFAILRKKLSGLFSRA